MTDDVLRLPFDQYQRYRLVADLLERLRGGGGPLSVLDVGGRTALLRRFLERDAITLVDLEKSDVREGMVLGDGARLPFQDGAFDVVCAFDTLEHVPREQRFAFTAECLRVARRWCVLAGPYATPRVARAEELLRRFMQDKLDFRHRYLEEHHEHGLPDRSEIERALAAGGARVASFGQGNLHRWLFMMCVGMLLDRDPALRDLAGDVFAYYNEALYPSDTEEPVYRHVVIAAKDGAELPDRESVFRDADADARSALRDPLWPTALMTAELAAFDRERAAWRAERASFEHTVADRERRLAEHAAVLTARDGDLARYQAAVERMDVSLKWLPVKLLVKLRETLGRRAP